MAADTGKRYSPGAILLWIFLLALGVFIAWGIYKSTFPPKPPMQGQMEARTISVASKTPGRIRRILVKEGDMVKKGQPVAELALPRLEAMLEGAQARRLGAGEQQSMVDEGPRVQQKDAARAEWERALAMADLAHKTFERLEALYKDGLISAERHDQARAQMLASQQEAIAAREKYDMAVKGSRPQEKAAAADASAEAAAAIAEVEALASDAVLYAPRDGQVDRVLLVEGEVIGAGFPALTLVDLADQWVTFNILENDMPGIKIGGELIGTVPAIDAKNASFDIYYISPRANYATWRSTREDSGYDMKTFEVRARPRGKLDGLRPGMSVLVASSRP